MKSLLSDKAYSIIKWIALIAIPVLAEAYVRLANVWNLPYAQEINETALIVTFVLGALIGVSTISYNASKNKTDITAVSDTLDTFENFKEGDDVK